MKRLVTLLLPVISIAVLFIVAETAIRVYHLVRWDIPILAPGSAAEPGGFAAITLDVELGWRATEDYQFSGLVADSEGEQYPVSMSQDERGFRMFGDLESTKPRLFVIGDSHTQAAGASDDRTYYAVVGEVLDMEVFAYGTGGFGSLQELMVLEKYVDVVQPDLVVWQFSVNDLVDNSPDMERETGVVQQGMTRPYWRDGRVQYILPQGGSVRLRRLSLQYCRVCRTITSRWDRVRATAARNPRMVEARIAPGQDLHEIFLESVQTTGEVMAEARRVVGGAPIAALIVGGDRESGVASRQALAEVARLQGLTVLTEVHEALLSVEDSGSVVRQADGAHWNEPGHRIIGEALAEAIRRRFPELTTSASVIDP